MSIANSLKREPNSLAYPFPLDELPPQSKCDLPAVGRIAPLDKRQQPVMSGGYGIFYMVVPTGDVCT